MELLYLKKDKLSFQNNFEKIISFYMTVQPQSNGLQINMTRL